MRRGTHRFDNREKGASLVEFSLVLPFLLLILLGIVDFGIRLADTHSLEDGIRDAARQAAVNELGGDTGCTMVGSATPTTATNEMVCLAKSRIGLPEGDIRVRVVIGAGGAVEGEPILVCAQYPAESITGFLPQFGSGVLNARSVMRLELDSDIQSYAETSLAGGWPGCSL